MTPSQTVHAFLACINAHDVNGLLALMSPNHRFVDSLGHSLQGHAAMRTAWQGYFAWFPDYHITIEDLLEQGNLVLITGQASGTFSVQGQLRPENDWSAPAAWKAIAEEGQLTHWQVYADNEPVREIMKKHENLEDEE